MADYGSSFGGYDALEPIEAAAEIRALTPSDAAAAQSRLIREAHVAGMREAAGIVDMHKKRYDAYSHIIDLAATKEAGNE